jgi:gamma-glutamylcyclotransferase (GGCT)/AIG2-like uncharacterized protein YtfP
MHFFAYGTLLIPDVMRRVTGRTLRATAATLRGYVALRVKGEVYPALVAFPDKLVEGILYFDLDAATLKRLDTFEGAGYRRTTVTVETCTGEWEEAVVYLARPALRRELLAKEWDADEFRERHLRKFLATCPAADAASPTRKSPSP